LLLGDKIREKSMANYVLVHGAWGGGQTYGEVPDRLRAAGHQVQVCALRGLGSRQGELHPGITLTDHVDDVCEQVAEAGFDRFILAGHSYGGMVISGVATRLGARIDAICYLDAFLPGDDQSLWDVTGGFEHAWYIDSQRHTPGLVAPIGSVDFAPVPGQVGFHPLLTLLEAIHSRARKRRSRAMLRVRERLGADALPQVRRAGHRRPRVGIP
jgi:pimeloyl-ACP methyl ester carboxylesterase